MQFREKIKLISDIILIGGTTKIPKIIEIIKETFPYSTIREDLDPFTTVAIGAALTASMIERPEKFDNINLLDVTNLSLGTNVYDEKENREVMDIIIKRSTSLNSAHGFKDYKTHHDYQTTIKNDVYEGENKELSNNLILGTLNICNLPREKKGKIKIRLEFKINKKDSILEVIATDLSNNKNYEKIEIPEFIGIEQNELNKLIKEEFESEIVYFPGYNNLRNNIIENQERIIKSNKKEAENINCENIDSLINLLKNEEVNKQLYFSYIIYIFSLLNNINDPDLKKEKFEKIFRNIQCNIEEKEILELLEFITDDILIEDYCSLFLIKYFYSKMKEFYYITQKEKKIDLNLLELKKCEKYLNLIKLLEEKLTFHKLIEKGYEIEIKNFQLKINIRCFLLNHKANKYTEKEAIEKALSFRNKIDDENIYVLFEEEKELSKICSPSLTEKKRKDDDADELILLLKLRPAKRPPKNKIINFIKSYIEEEIKEFIYKYENKQIMKTKEELLFIKIFCKNNCFTNNNNNKSIYIDMRYKEEIENFECYFNFVIIRRKFIENPFKTLLMLITIYKNEAQEDIDYLNALKNKYKNLKDKIENLRKDENGNEKNEFLFLSSILKKYPPYEGKLYEYESFEPNKKFNNDYNYKRNKIIKFYEKKEEYDMKDDKEKFKYFKIFCEIYQLSYIKTHYTKGIYLSILNAVKMIRKNYEEKHLFFDNLLYERKIYDPGLDVLGF